MPPKPIPVLSPGIRPAPLLMVSLLLSAPLATVLAQSPHCGTGLWMERHLEIRKTMKRTTAARTAAALKPIRTLETPHFLIHYVMRGPNRVKLLPDDQALAALVDSLYASLPGTVQGDAADSTVYARLAARQAGHPVYIQTMVGIFENAHGYYVDTLGMRTPSESSPTSVYYSAPTKPSVKYPVDVVDIGTADPSFRGQEIYALTYPTGYGGMLMENDFLFNTKMGLDGIPTGDSISSRYQGRLVHNYAAEWSLGLKVTCYHEYYHSVQFAYTPKEQRFHLWYETSATGMEERKAPEVNDYLQYLPAYMGDLGDRGMLAFPEGGLSRYGNAIYFVFLTKDLGEGFDVRIWNRLAENGNRIEEALTSVHAFHGKTSSEVYARFGAQLAFSGTDAANPVSAFSPDISLWPRLPLDSVDLRSSSTFASDRRHPPMSILAVSLQGSGGSGKAMFLSDTALRTLVARLRPDSSILESSRAKTVPLDIRGAGGEVIAVITNGTLDQTAAPFEIRMLSSRVDTAVHAYPNPLTQASGEAELIFSRLPDRAASVRIFGENGTMLRALAFSTVNGLWSWDLTDTKGRKVKPGIYYYRVDSGRLKPILIR